MQLILVAGEVVTELPEGPVAEREEGEAESQVSPLPVRPRCSEPVTELLHKPLQHLILLYQPDDVPHDGAEVLLSDANLGIRQPLISTRIRFLPFVTSDFASVSFF